MANMAIKFSGTGRSPGSRIFAVMAAGGRSPSLFAQCSGFNGSCPWKASHGLALDAGEKKCPLCSAEMLQEARKCRQGQDLTMALAKLKEISHDSFRQGLARLERFAGELASEDYKGRVERAERRRALSAMRRPAASTEGAAPEQAAPEARD